jgi:hypothetical protein
MKDSDRAAILALAYGVSQPIRVIGQALLRIHEELECFAESLSVESTETAKECQTIPAPPPEVLADPDGWVADGEALRRKDWESYLVPRVSER